MTLKSGIKIVQYKHVFIWCCKFQTTRTDKPTIPSSMRGHTGRCLGDGVHMSTAEWESRPPAAPPSRAPAPGPGEPSRAPAAAQPQGGAVHSGAA